MAYPSFTSITGPRRVPVSSERRGGGLPGEPHQHSGGAFARGFEAKGDVSWRTPSDSPKRGARAERFPGVAVGRAAYARFSWDLRARSRQRSPRACLMASAVQRGADYDGISTSSLDATS